MEIYFKGIEKLPEEKLSAMFKEVENDYNTNDGKNVEKIIDKYEEGR